MTSILTFENDHPTPSQINNILTTLESGGVIYLPHAAFPEVQAYPNVFNDQLLGEKSKNITLENKPNILRGFAGSPDVAKDFFSFMQAYRDFTRKLVHQIFPTYTNYLEELRTNFRIKEISDRKTTKTKDDKRLHIDAFPATPIFGKRILRVFSNVHPEGKSRDWIIGETFPQVFKMHQNKLKRPFSGRAKLLKLLKLSHEEPSLYDQYMTQLHNKMKYDEDYQKKAQKSHFSFPAGSTWIILTDSLAHAVTSGQYAIEQTFLLPVEAMQHPEKSPLHILQNAFGEDLLKVV